MHAEVSYADPNTRSFAGWGGIVGGITLAVAALVAVIAYLARNPAPRYLARSRDRVDPAIAGFSFDGDCDTLANRALCVPLRSGR